MNISDPNSHKDMYKDRGLKFEQRIQYLVLMLTFYKSRCEDLMKGTATEELVASPRQKYMSSKANKRNNGRRQVQLALGKEAEGHVNGEKGGKKVVQAAKEVDGKIEERKRIFAGPFGVVDTAADAADGVDGNTNTRGNTPELNDSRYPLTPKGTFTNIPETSAH